MSLTTRRPLRLGGSNFHSGAPNTGELQYTRGGSLRFTANSGGLLSLGSGGGPAPVVVTADHAVIFSGGGGRLNTIIPHQAISGVALRFYDSSVVARSGPGTYQESGRAVVGVVGANSFNGINVLAGPVPIIVDCPFYSGLAVAGTSGIPGFTVTYTPEVNPAYGE